MTTGTVLPSAARSEERLAIQRVPKSTLIARRFARNKAALAGFAIFALLALLAIAGPFISQWRYDDLDFNALKQPPSAAHWLGTDIVGADMFALVVRGLGRSLLIGVIASLGITVTAAFVGTAIAYFEGWREKVGVWIVDMLLVIPTFFLLAIMVKGATGTSGWLWLTAALTIFGWVGYARILRSIALSLRERDYIAAAKFMGVPSLTILRRHMIPNLGSILIIHTVLGVVYAVQAETGLSFLGFGITPPDTSLGVLIRAGSSTLLTAPWMFLEPAAMLLALCFSMTMVGDGLRDALDPSFWLVASSMSTASLTPRPPADGARVDAGNLQDAVLHVADLHVTFGSEAGPVRAVRGVSYDLRRGRTLGIVGESGSGKSVTALAIMGLLPETATISGSVQVRGRELIGLGDGALSEIRGRNLAMIFQDPLSALTPVLSIGEQLAEALDVHQSLSRPAVRARSIELLDLVGIPDPAERMKSYPHQLSGGMRQRVMIAIAIANKPDVIIADEPTTALDVTIQAQVLEVLRAAQRETGAAVVIITHDLGIVAGLADDVLVMYAGRPVERGTVEDIFYRPTMPYTMGLLAAVPRPDLDRSQRLVPIEGTPPSLVALPPGCPFVPRCPLAEDRCREREPPLAVHGENAAHRAACVRATEIESRGLRWSDVFPVPAALPSKFAGVPRAERTSVLEVQNLRKRFTLSGGGLLRRRLGTVRAVDGVSFDVREAETLALVGESGCGKTTTLLEIMRLAPPDSGAIVILSHDVKTLSSTRAQMQVRREMQIVFQDPLASLDPRMPVYDILAEPLTTHGWTSAAVNDRIGELMRLVDLDPEHVDRFPEHFSGGQRQRIAIARALALAPKLIVLDEPVSSLDVSIQAGVINLLEDLQAKLGLSYLFVAHNLSVVRHIADRIAVMYLGRIVEIGEVERVFNHPRHPYTRALLSAVPVPDPKIERRKTRILLSGDLPSATATITGCRFRTRCPTYKTLTDGQRVRCDQNDPALTGDGVTDLAAACHYPTP